MFSLVLLVFYNLLLAKSDAHLKTWNVNLNYANANNWDLKRIPCENDRVVFEENVAVYVESSIKAGEIILPMNGQLVFGDKASIFVSGTKQGKKGSSCDGQEIKFKIQEQYDWYDAVNWNQTISQTTSTLSNSFNGRIDEGNPIPHSERIPCSQDDVSFPERTTFKVNLDSRVSIKSLKIGSHEYKTNTFEQLTKSSMGKQLFDLKSQNSGSESGLEIDSSLGCNNQAGCKCGNDEPKTLAKICSKLSSGCPINQCSDPIRPAGHCCDICASVLTMRSMSGFNFVLFQDLVDMYLRNKDKYPGVNGYMHRLSSDNQLQLVLIDGDKKGAADKMANELSKYIIDGPTVYAIKDIQVRSSIDWSQGGFTFGKFMLILFILALIAGSGFVLFQLYKRNRIASAFSFVRFGGFENERIELEMGSEMGTTPHDELDPSPPNVHAFTTKYKANTSQEEEEASVKFENPVFKSDSSLDSKVNVKQLSEDSKEVENPIFSLIN